VDCAKQALNGHTTGFVVKTT